MNSGVLGGLPLGLGVFLPGLEKVREVFVADGVAMPQIDISDIPQNFAHLLVITSLRGDAGAAGDTLGIRFNGDSAANYDAENIAAFSTTMSPSAAVAQTAIKIWSFAAASAPAGIYSPSAFFLADYANATRQKEMVGTGFSRQGTTAGAMLVWVSGGGWRLSEPINRITLLGVGSPSGNIVGGSRVSVYAIP